MRIIEPLTDIDELNAFLNDYDETKPDGYGWNFGDDPVEETRFTITLSDTPSNEVESDKVGKDGVNDLLDEFGLF